MVRCQRQDSILKSSNLTPLLHPQHHFPLPDDVAFFDKGNRHKSIRGGANVVQRPVVVVLRQHLPDAFGPVNNGNPALLPIKQLNAVVQLLFQTVDGHLNFNVLLSGQGRNGNCDVSHKN